MATDSLGNQQVDFVWGNIPMQPNTDRGTALTSTLGDHAVVSAEYNGFPGSTYGAPYDDLIDNVAVPDVVGKTESAANTDLTGLGLVKGDVTTADNAAGATSGNDGKVKSQSPAAGTVVNVGTEVDLVKYAYTAG